MNRFQRYYYIGQALGWDNLPRRVWQMVRKRMGVLRRRLPGGALSEAAWRRVFAADYDPARADAYWRDRASRFFVHPGNRVERSSALRALVPDDIWRAQVTERVTDLEAGWMELFSRHRVHVENPPRFNRNALHGIEWPVGGHWTTYDQFNPQLGDLKCVWEPSRFSWAFTLAREYIRNESPLAARLFWSFLEAWDAQNPYGLTPQWVCGQESSFRCFAWLFAACATLDAEEATPARLHRLTQLVWYTARHVDVNIVYARSQKNNHAISEAVCLLTIGLLFPEFRQASIWREKGQRVLEQELSRQIYPDGSYVQHSMNYHRVMLDDVVWAVQLCKLTGTALSERALSRFAASVEWLLAFVESASGHVPNYGANDGARVLPLSCTDYPDFRPIAQTAAFLASDRRRFPSGVWDEQLLHLCGPAALDGSVRPPQHEAELSARSGGYYLLRGAHSAAMIRCHTYRDRPGQADMLHLDLSWHGENVLRDGGSYSYFTEPPFQDYFHSTGAHNTVEVDGQDQMIKGPRFLWLRWVRAAVLQESRSDDGRVDFFVGSHQGYRRLPGRIEHRRSVLRHGDSFVIVDDILGQGVHDAVLRWRLLPTEWETMEWGYRARVGDRGLLISVQASVPCVPQWVEGSAGGRAEGWESRYYAEKQPVPTLRASVRGELPIRFVTAIGDEHEVARVVAVSLPPEPVQVARCDPFASAIEQVTAGRVAVAEEHEVPVSTEA